MIRVVKVRVLKTLKRCLVLVGNASRSRHSSATDKEKN